MPARRSPPGTWTRPRVVDALQDWTRFTGAPPRSYEWAPATAATLGLTSARVRLWADRHPRWPSAKTVCARFGRWSDALRAAGLPPHRSVAPGAGREARIVAALEMARAGLGTAAIAEVLDVSPRTVRDYLRAGRCADCGTPVVTARRCPRCAARRAMRPRATREEVVAGMRAWAERTGRPPRLEEWAPAGDRRLSYVTVKTLFGSWAAALAAAGFPPNRNAWDRETIAAALRAFTAEHGRAPRQSELRHPHLPSPSTIRRHHGTYAAALERAGAPQRRATLRPEKSRVPVRGAPGCGGSRARAASAA
ncbi:MAG TPA: hypothetical protein VHF89_06765 [Solirubrobacteraceae bacterium]|nr:hypothetical protein [Solirubrobacteraceae bacterium]